MVPVLVFEKGQEMLWPFITIRSEGKAVEFFG